MGKLLRILILEDQPADAELVTGELRKAGLDFVAKTVTTEKEYLAELRTGAPHLILADYSLPGYDGLSALAAAQKQCPQTPFVFVSGSMGEEKAIETLHLGATDCVLKQRLARLGPAKAPAPGGPNPGPGPQTPSRFSRFPFARTLCRRTISPAEQESFKK